MRWNPRSSTASCALAPSKSTSSLFNRPTALRCMQKRVWNDEKQKAPKSYRPSVVFSCIVVALPRLEDVGASEFAGGRLGGPLFRDGRLWNCSFYIGRTPHFFLSTHSNGSSCRWR